MSKKKKRRRRRRSIKNVFAWEISRTEEPGRLQSMASQRVGYNLATEQHNQADCDLGKYFLMEMWHKMESEVT